LESPQIHQFQHVYVTYESLSNLLVEGEHIRCHPKFHNRARDDTALVTLPSRKNVFARMRLLFSCKTISGKVWQLGLVTLFKTALTPGASSTGMRKLMEDKPNESVLIDLNWIQRAAYLVQDFKYERVYTAVDLVDGDMYLRLLNLDIV
jgi:hypothetical protein